MKTKRSSFGFQFHHKILIPLIIFMGMGLFYFPKISHSAAVNAVTQTTGKNISTHMVAKPDVATGEIIVKFKKKLKHVTNKKIKIQDTGIVSIDKKNKANGVLAIDPVISDAQLSSQGSKVKARGLDRIYKIKAAENTDVKSLSETYKNDANVEYAQPNYLYKVASIVPNDTLFGSQWALSKIKASEAWDITTGSSAITVAVIDMGVDYTHQDLAANIWRNSGENGMTQPGDSCWTGISQDKKNNACDDDGNGLVDDWQGWNFSGNDNNVMDSGSNGDFHGTHVSGIIAAVGNNNSGVSGLTWSSKIMPLKIFNNEEASTFDAALAIGYAADQGAKVINISWGAENVFDYYLEDAINYAHSKNVVVVDAAGNGSSDVYNFSPANIANGITVSATAADDSIANFTNWGTKIDVSAPGTNILSTYPVNIYQTMSGTSMAAPFVSGLAALILAHDPSLSNEEVRQVIKTSSDDLGSAGPDLLFGAGRINAYNALMASAPLTAYVSSPTSLGLGVNGAVPVIGTASGNNFQNYVLEYGEGSTPANWTQIASSTTPVGNGVLGLLNVDSLRSGVYSLKLTVTDASNKKYQFRNYFDVLTNPLKPTAFVFVSTQSGISLSWEAPSSQFPIANYEIYRSESSDFSNPTVYTTADVTYADAMVQVGHTYYYKVRAYDNQTPKKYSDFTDSVTVSVTTAIVDHITISPATEQNITAGQTIQFTAKAKDYLGSDIPDAIIEWEGADNGFFNQTGAGIWSVVARSGAVGSSEVLVNVNPGPLAQVTVYPQDDRPLIWVKLLNLELLRLINTEIFWLISRNLPGLAALPAGFLLLMLLEISLCRLQLDLF